MLRKVIHDALNEEFDAYVALNGTETLDGVSVEMILEQTLGQVDAWNVTKEEQKEVRSRIEEKLTAYKA